MILVNLSKPKRRARISLFLAIILLAETIYPTAGWALTSGPSQPEVQSFQPVSTSDMVDLFSGDFKYNIPLMDVEGYPLNIFYSSGITNDQEASYVGLGWNLGTGSLTRNMRGLPDDFNGDNVNKEFNMKPNETYLLSGALGFELFGKELKNKIEIGANMSVGAAVKYNNYNGIGFEMTTNLGFSAGNSSKGTLNAGLGLRTSDDGLTISPNISFSKEREKAKFFKRMGYSFGAAMNSRDGLKNLSLGISSYTKDEYTKVKTQKEFSVTATNGVGYAYTPGVLTFTPESERSFNTFSANMSIKLGGTVFASDITWDIAAVYSRQTLQSNNVDYPAYGFYYSEKSNENSLRDFNREKDGGFNYNTPSLPITNFTYDTYSVSGQGVGGSYRTFRSDVGHVSDPYVYSPSSDIHLGAEILGGNLFKGGFDISINKVSSYSSSWDNYDNALFHRFSFKDKDHLESTHDNYKAEYEPAYFKESGEMSVDADPDFFNSMGAFEPVRPKLKKTGMRTKILGDNLRMKTSETSESNLTTPAYNYRTQRQRRNQHLSMLTKKEAMKYGLDPRIYNGTHPDMNMYSSSEDHFAEITALRTDGARYVYGLPTYNTYQEEASFNVKQPDASNLSCARKSGLVDYTNTDNSIKNDQGLDNYYDKEKLPAYAYSYLLTSVLSADYVDNDNVTGPSEGDNGSYTKFTYTKAYDNYGWRTPYAGNKANYNEGYTSIDYDDKGSYVYGTKEIWYIKSIETKNYVAEFDLGDRFDAVEAQGPQGGMENATGAGHRRSMKYLKAIHLYTKEEYKNGANKVPVKSVHFEYDYSLCPKPVNSCASPDVNFNFDATKPLPSDGSVQNITGNGKLTLKKIYFTYGRSFRAKQNAYHFSYGRYYDAANSTYANFNPAYSLKDYDRWGNYKPNSANPNDPLNAEYPYSEQNKALADKYVAAWNLSEIKLPSGGTIQVDYEADDYAYVQDKQAMQMFKIKSMGPNTNPTSNLLMTDFLGIGNPGNDNNLDIYVDLEKHLSASLSQSDADAELSRRYLNNNTISQIYFRCYTEIYTTNNGADHHYEYVSGYADIEGIEAVKSGGSGLYNQAKVKLKAVDIGDREGSKDVNPISKAAWQLGRVSFNRQVHNLPEPGSNVSMEDLSKELWQNNIITGLVNGLRGENRELMNKNFGKKINLNKSWIRLSNPYKNKIGGGCRVKQLKLVDNWDAMQNGTTAQVSAYGQVYDYTKTDDITGETISSGVAAYEPQIGQEENPFKVPVYFNDYKKQRLLAPDDRFYMEEPFGESFFPGASVGYSKVTVKNLSYSNVTKHATGRVEHEFYTSYDFPVRTSRTYLLPKKLASGSPSIVQNKTNPVFSLFKLNVRHFLTASQGYVVELNDMNGKPKSQKVFAEGQATPISEVKYFYKTNPNNNKELNNMVVTLKKDGTIQQNSMIGVEFDMVTDFRESGTENINVGAQYNTATFLAGLIPGFAPSVWPTFNREVTRFRSGVITKVIQRYGILDHTEVYDGGSKISTDNLAYDAETGEVLITRTQNNFEDPLYSFKFPAHWAYDNMGMAYKNMGVSFSNIAISNGGTTVARGAGKFVPGDELSVNEGGTSLRAWVKTVGISGTNATLSLIDKTGNPVQAFSSAEIKIIRSGRRNQHMTPIASVVSALNPLDYNKDGAIDISIGASYNNVINASAIEFSDDWKLFCECGNDQPHVYNPYVAGRLGNWRPLKSYAFLTGREQSNTNNNTDIRKDGTYSNFTPFWVPNTTAGVYQKSNSSAWQFASQITAYSPYGVELENKDALNRYSASLYGYNYNLPVAVSGNANYRQIAFDGFEDYDYRACPDDHLGLKAGNTANVKENNSTYQKYSHTGRRSIKVAPAQKKTLVKVLKGCEE